MFILHIGKGARPQRQTEPCFILWLLCGLRHDPRWDYQRLPHHEFPNPSFHNEIQREMQPTRTCTALRALRPGPVTTTTTSRPYDPKTFCTRHICRRNCWTHHERQCHTLRHQVLRWKLRTNGPTRCASAHHCYPRGHDSTYAENAQTVEAVHAY